MPLYSFNVKVHLHAGFLGRLFDLISQKASLKNLHVNAPLGYRKKKQACIWKHIINRQYKYIIRKYVLKFYRDVVQSLIKEYLHGV
jgi:hypothetical protein